MRAIDTNVLIRLLTGDDPRQYRRAAELVQTGAWVSHVVLVETVWVLSSVYDCDRHRIARAIAMMLEHAQLRLEAPDVVAAALDRFTANRGVEFSDCLILETARKAGHLPLGSFDRALAGLDGAVRP